MRWILKPPFTRISLRRAAVRYADHRWDVLPGAWLEGSRFACGRPAWLRWFGVTEPEMDRLIEQREQV